MLPYGNTLDRLARACGEPKLLSSERIRADTVAHLSADDRKRTTGASLGCGVWDPARDRARATPLRSPDRKQRRGRGVGLRWPG